MRGDVPGRLDGSTQLVVERRDGKVVNLPQVELPLDEVHELVVSRAGLG